MLADDTPAAITIRICFLGLSSGLMSFSTRSTSQGFTTTQTMSAQSAANLLSVVTATPILANFSTTLCEGSLTVMSSFLNVLPLIRPSTVEPPMAPAPIIDIFIIYSSSGCTLISLSMKSSASAFVRHRGGNSRRMSCPAQPVKQCSCLMSGLRTIL